MPAVERVGVGRRHLLPVVVGVVSLLLTLASAVAARQVIATQESSLLAERERELGALVRASGGEVSAYLTALADAALIPGDSSFLSRARQLAVDGVAVGVASLTASGVRDVRVVQPDGRISHELSRLQRTAVELTRRTDELAYTVLRDGDGRHLLHVLRATPASRVVAFRDTPLPAVLRPGRPTPDSPYQDLNVEIYVGDRARPDQLIVLSGSPPSGGDVVRRQLITVGAEQVLMVLSPRTPLVGAFAARLQWVVLVGGLALAALLTMLVHVLVRRRAYALKLVQARTAETRVAQTAAEAANASKSEFLSRVSHELRTPLHAVLGYSQLLAMDEITEDQMKSVGQIERGGQHLLRLINEILDISSIEAGRLVLQVKPIRVQPLLSAAVDFMQPVAADADVELVAAFGDGPDLGSVLADDQRLTQVLLNLLGNAVKYNDAGGRVLLSCTSGDGVVRIEVTDDGPGIAREHQQLLFAPFERLGADRRSIEGTGIGLTLAQRLCTAMGGRLEVRSELGAGSTFAVLLPAAAPSPRPHAGPRLASAQIGADR